MDSQKPRIVDKSVVCKVVGTRLPLTINHRLRRAALEVILHCLGTECSKGVVLFFFLEVQFEYFEIIHLLLHYQLL